MKITVRILVKILVIILSGLLVLGILYGIHKKIQEMARVRQVRLAYTLLQNAYTDSIKTENFQWKKNSMNTVEFSKGFNKHLSIKEDCKLQANKTCFAPQLHYARALGTTSWSPLEGYYKLSLNNGMNVAYKVLSPDCSYVRGRCATILVDINGIKGPNQLGTDVFDFAIFKNELKTYEAEIVHRERCLEGNGQGCADYIIRFGNMNYKKINKYLAKEGKFIPLKNKK